MYLFFPYQVSSTAMTTSLLKRSLPKYLRLVLQQNSSRQFCRYSSFIWWFMPRRFLFALQIIVCTHGSTFEASLGGTIFLMCFAVTSLILLKPRHPSLLTAFDGDTFADTVQFIVSALESGITTIFTKRNAEDFLFFFGLPRLGSTFAITKTLPCCSLPLPRLGLSFFLLSEWVLKKVSSSSTTQSNSYLSSREPIIILIFCIKAQIASQRLCPSWRYTSSAAILFLVMVIKNIV